MQPRIATKPGLFTESVIREMTRLCQLHQGINLAQGFPDFPAPLALKDAACTAIQADINQYAITWGAKPLRDAIAAKYRRCVELDLDPERHITVACGATESMMAAIMAVVDPGDEVIVFEPFYENYGPDTVLTGAAPRYVTLHEPDWSIDPDELRAAFNARTRAIIINTPHNPTGKVYSRDELDLIAELCRQWNVVAITDEIYEHMVYDGLKHISLATMPGMFERTITISGLSKTYSVTGWRIGYLIAAPEITTAIRKVHDFLTVGAPAPLQAAAVTALDLPASYYDELLRSYTEKRASMSAILTEAGFRVYHPAGAYYMMTDISDFGLGDDVAFVRRMIEEVGVAAVPGTSFYHRKQFGRSKVRFAFPKRPETLAAAAERLSRLRALAPTSAP
ncbi:MAG: aminotransferase class I/II-fold pyridoxal phosphate-dependent enzyme [Chloroflexi bacterium]|nr:aminotransferase class I/II-fold pyridoxal phosphate-dependent enzyme [Chloroflexota bacterium]